MLERRLLGVASFIDHAIKIYVRQKEHKLGQHLLIPCFLSPGEDLVGEGGRLLLLIINILLFVFKSKKNSVKVYFQRTSSITLLALNRQTLQ